MNHMIDLSEIQTYEARNGDVLTGTAGEDIHLFIAPGATVTLNGVTLACMNAQNRWAAITCLGDARIVLEGVNIVRCGNEHFPGILPAEGKTLTLGGTGSLSIGCGLNGKCGDITIGKKLTYLAAKRGNCGDFPADDIGRSVGGTCGSVVNLLAEEHQAR